MNPLIEIVSDDMKKRFPSMDYIFNKSDYSIKETWDHDKIKSLLTNMKLDNDESMIIKICEVNFKFNKKYLELTLAGLNLSKNDEIEVSIASWLPENKPVKFSKNNGSEAILLGIRNC